MRQEIIEQPQNWLSHSWQRSLKAGILKNRAADNIKLGNAQLGERKACLSRVISLTEQFAKPLFCQLFARTNSKLILSDADGVIIASWGKKQFDDKLASISLETGICWQEKVKGTNAIGTAIVEQRAISVIGNQHFVNRHHFISCSACPIFDYEGNLLGILDITSEQRLHHGNTLQLVQSMVRRIENELLFEHPDAKTRFDLALDESLITSGWQGIAIADEDGNIVAHNNIATQLLDQTEIVGKPIEHIIERCETPLFCKRQSQITKTPHKVGVYSASTSLHFGDERIEQAWQQSCRLINKGINILLLGETGVGKNEFVKQLHHASNRKKQPLVTVNCGAIPKDLMESELFGYAPGAFTGASSKGYEGKIRNADKGILFLDEIADMPLDAQCRLLHVLQDKEIIPVGSNQTYSVDIQVVSATHKNLEQLVSQGLFRQDLYYRLNGLVIDIPPLRDRKDKRQLIEKVHEKHQQGSQLIDDGLMKALMTYQWPGNIRELDNVIKVSSLLSDGEESLTAEHIPSHLLKAVSIPLNASDSSQIETLRDTVEDTLITSYKAHKGNISRTAQALGVSRNTLYRRLRKIGILK
ncbi:sigma-54-dependent Fis family transcriptional regulator [Vibrio hannami]|uniref:sigma-54-dependent Fis family transcriptional regulator n=1 Tax=Vibrio hannami TaxID=2717094 RepID=UPI002410114F|nr:sigma-54-dependent Fis family transcriptional regulator [Vibrio hannami]MDG3085829.1 sigma-54-dependent Fis family transcriptional regulator [Vibrio hannami]